MNKAELISAVAEKTGLSKKDSEKAINATFEMFQQVKLIFSEANFSLKLL